MSQIIVTAEATRDLSGEYEVLDGATAHCPKCGSDDILCVVEATIRPVVVTLEGGEHGVAAGALEAVDYTPPQFALCGGCRWEGVTDDLRIDLCPCSETQGKDNEAR
jgi:hypothetical protein